MIVTIRKNDHARNWDRLEKDLQEYVEHYRAERIRILEAADQQAKDEQLTLNLELDEHEE
tara:strand:- start:702 stop:881 length:180 start_codon:yes stop_codon:yes gene_type:complete